MRSENPKSGIVISTIPKCIQGLIPDQSLQDWLSSLNHEDGNKMPSDKDIFSEEDFQFARNHLSIGRDLKRFGDFADFKEYLLQYISSQICSKECLKEFSPPKVFSEKGRLHVARSCPEAPPVPEVAETPQPKAASKPPAIDLNAFTEQVLDRMMSLREKKPEKESLVVPPLPNSLMVYPPVVLVPPKELFLPSLEELKKAVTLPSPLEGYDLLFIIDTSGSMEVFYNRLIEYFEKIWRGAIESVKTDFLKNFRMGAMTFVDGRFRLNLPLAKVEDSAELLQFREKFKEVVDRNGGGHEPVADAIYTAMEYTNWDKEGKINREKLARKIIVLTDGDGLDEKANKTSSGRTIDQMVKEAEKQGYLISVINVDESMFRYLRGQ